MESHLQGTLIDMCKRTQLSDILFIDTKLAPNHPSHKLYKLPVELLARIFTLHKDVSDDASDDRYLPYPACLPITRVCRHWRTVALSHPTLWTSITPGLSLRWIKACMERSQSLLMDFDIGIGHASLEYSWDNPRSHGHKDIIVLLSDFTRVGSLRLTGEFRNISLILDSFHTSLPLHRFSLCLVNERSRHLTLSDDLFGGNAPIRRLEFRALSYVVAPNWLLRGVTYFNCDQLIGASELLDTLRQMSSLTYFELGSLGGFCSRKDELPVPVQMPQLMHVIVHCTHDIDSFVLLNRLLLLPVGVKRRLELKCIRLGDDLGMEGILPLLEATNGIQHLHFSGKLGDGWFRMWTGSTATAWEDSEFCLFTKWGDGGRPHSDREISEFRHRIIALCDTLGAAQARRLVIDFPAPYTPYKDAWRWKPLKSLPGIKESYWWETLQRLPGIEELELHPARAVSRSVLVGGTWKVSRDRPPACWLPGLRRVQIIVPEVGRSESPHQYRLSGDLPTLRIVRVSTPSVGDITCSHIALVLYSTATFAGAPCEPPIQCRPDEGKRASEDDEC